MSAVALNEQGGVLAFVTICVERRKSCRMDKGSALCVEEITHYP